jgi:serine/threonine-protein kinase
MLALGLLGLLVWARNRKKRRFWRTPGAWPPADQGPGLPSEVVGPYRLDRLLGRGGFADTFFARHEITGQVVALKLPHPHRADDPEFRARFRLEARLGALLDHPNLVRILDPGPEEGRPYLAMEYVPGERLDERLQARGALPLMEALNTARQVAEAMAHAHAHGVVHRDLKPGNILLTPGGAKVMDLGIARVMDAETVTTTYAFLGTPLYAAPEAQLKTHVGPAADRYSLGVILFHMLAGQPPFQGETPFEILDRHRSALPPDLQALRPEAPGTLLRLVIRLLDKEPDQRPDDAEITRTLIDLEAALSGPPIPPAAPPPG